MTRVQMLAVTCLLMLSFTSCKKSSKGNLDTSVAALSLENFRNEASISEVSLLMDRIMDINPSKDLNTFISLRKEMNGKVDVLVAKYGKEKTIAYARQSLQIAKQNNSTGISAFTGECCQRQNNGSGPVDASCCNFWESFVVAIESAWGCDQGTTQEAAQRYYNCVQSYVCDDC